jgi:hypothetical protein
MIFKSDEIEQWIQYIETSNSDFRIRVIEIVNEFLLWKCAKAEQAKLEGAAVSEAAADE